MTRDRDDIRQLIEALDQVITLSDRLMRKLVIKQAVDAYQSHPLFDHFINNARAARDKLSSETADSSEGGSNEVL